MRLQHKLGIAVFAMMLALMISVAAAPLPAQLSTGTPVTKGFFKAGFVDAQGGNATYLNATTETQTLAWQGFYGEVTGTITLRDNGGDQMYNWTWTTKTGTVLASRDGTVDFTAIAAQNDCTIDEGLTGLGSDRTNRTFTQSNNTQFTIGGITIAQGTACAAHTYVNSLPQAANFEETILTDDGGNTSVYATRIENNAQGFDNSTHDFQMIVPDHTNRTTTTYYFYAELQ